MSMQPPITPTQPAAQPLNVPLGYQQPLGQYASAVWRDGYLLVATKNARFPERCIKCNAPATTFLKRDLRWHGPLIYLLILVNLLVYALVAICVQKKGTVHIGLCQVHRQKRFTLILTGWGFFFAAILSTVLAIYLQSALFGIAIPLLILAALIVAVMCNGFVKVDHIDDKYVYLKSINKDFLLSLPGQAPNQAALDQIVVQQLQQRY